MPWAQPAALRGTREPCDNNMLRECAIPSHGIERKVTVSSGKQNGHMNSIAKARNE